MRKVSVTILAAALAAALPVAALADDAGDGGSGVLTRPPFGSRARQLSLKLRLTRELAGVTLAVSLDHNRQQWQMLSPDQREQFRRYAVAFLKKHPEEQKRLMSRYTLFLVLSREQQEIYRQRARWLKKVAASFTPEQRAELERMLPMDRARVLLERKAKLIRAGVLPADEPATAPADGPADE